MLGMIGSVDETLASELRVARMAHADHFVAPSFQRKTSLGASTEGDTSVYSAEWWCSYTAWPAAGGAAQKLICTLELVVFLLQ